MKEKEKGVVYKIGRGVPLILIILLFRGLLSGSVLTCMVFPRPRP